MQQVMPWRTHGAISTDRAALALQAKPGKKARRFMLVVFCVPVAPGRSRLIWAFPRNFAVWLDMIIPRWVYHINQNSVLDSDAYILHVEVTESQMPECFVHHSLASSLSLSGSMDWKSSFCRSASLLHQALITGRRIATCPHRRTPWSSHSGTGSGSTARIMLAG